MAQRQSHYFARSVSEFDSRQGRAVPNYQLEEFGWLLIGSGNPGLESQQPLRDSMSPLNCLDYLPLLSEESGKDASSWLVGFGTQRSLEPMDYSSYYSYYHYY